MYPLSYFDINNLKQKYIYCKDLKKINNYNINYARITVPPYIETGSRASFIYKQISTALDSHVDMIDFHVLQKNFIEKLIELEVLLFRSTSPRHLWILSPAKLLQAFTLNWSVCLFILLFIFL